MRCFRWRRVPKFRKKRKVHLTSRPRLIFTFLYCFHYLFVHKCQNGRKIKLILVQNISKIVFCRCFIGNRSQRISYCGTLHICLYANKNGLHVRLPICPHDRSLHHRDGLDRFQKSGFLGSAILAVLTFSQNILRSPRNGLQRHWVIILRRT